MLALYVARFNRWLGVCAIAHFFVSATVVFANILTADLQCAAFGDVF
jgi:hypothetical protein